MMYLAVGVGLLTMLWTAWQVTRVANEMSHIRRMDEIRNMRMNNIGGANEAAKT